MFVCQQARGLCRAGPKELRWELRQELRPEELGAGPKELGQELCEKELCQKPYGAGPGATKT